MTPSVFSILLQRVAVNDVANGSGVAISAYVYSWLFVSYCRRRIRRGVMAGNGQCRSVSYFVLFGGRYCQRQYQPSADGVMCVIMPSAYSIAFGVAIG